MKPFTHKYGRGDTQRGNAHEHGLVGEGYAPLSPAAIAAIAAKRSAGKRSGAPAPAAGGAKPVKNLPQLQAPGAKASAPAAKPLVAPPTKGAPAPMRALPAVASPGKGPKAPTPLAKAPGRLDKGQMAVKAAAHDKAEKAAKPGHAKPGHAGGKGHSGGGHSPLASLKHAGEHMQHVVGQSVHQAKEATHLAQQGVLQGTATKMAHEQVAGGEGGGGHHYKGGGITHEGMTGGLSGKTRRAWR